MSVLQRFTAKSLTIWLRGLIQEVERVALVHHNNSEFGSVALSPCVVSITCVGSPDYGHPCLDQRLSACLLT